MKKEKWMIILGSAILSIGIIAGCDSEGLVPEEDTEQQPAESPSSTESDTQTIPTISTESDSSDHNLGETDTVEEEEVDLELNEMDIGSPPQLEVTESENMDDENDSEMEGQ